MTILWTLVVGLVAGALAKLAMPGKDPGGIVLTMAIGLVYWLLFIRPQGTRAWNLLEAAGDEHN